MMYVSPFHERAGMRRGRGFIYPRPFPSLDWQLFVRRLDVARTLRAIRTVHRRPISMSIKRVT